MLEQAPSVINTLDASHASNVWCVILCSGNRVTPRVPGLNALAWNVVRARDVEAKSQRRPMCLGSVMWTQSRHAALSLPVRSLSPLTPPQATMTRRGEPRRCHRRGCVSV